MTVRTSPVRYGEAFVWGGFDNWVFGVICALLLGVLSDYIAGQELSKYSVVKYSKHKDRSMGRMRHYDNNFRVKVLLVLLAVGLTGAACFAVYANQSQKSIDNTTAATTNKAVIASDDAVFVAVGDKTKYCSNAGGLCFIYPNDWKFTKIADTTDGTDVSITSPSGKVKVYYSPVVTGIGGSCPDKTCYFHALSITAPTSSDYGTLNIVKGVSINKDKENAYEPEYIVSSSDLTNDFVIGRDVETVFYGSLRNPEAHSTQFLGVASTGSTSGYATMDEAKAWFEQPDIAAAGEILNTVSIFD